MAAKMEAARGLLGAQGLDFHGHVFECFRCRQQKDGWTAMKIEAVGERRSLLGEGPHWDTRTHTLLYDDANRFEIVRYDPELRTETVVARLGNHVFVLSNAAIARRRTWQRACSSTVRSNSGLRKVQT